MQSSNRSNYNAIFAAGLTAALRDRDAAYPASKNEQNPVKTTSTTTANDMYVLHFPMFINSPANLLGNHSKFKSFQLHCNRCSSANGGYARSWCSLSSFKNEQKSGQNNFDNNCQRLAFSDVHKLTRQTAWQSSSNRSNYIAIAAAVPTVALRDRDAAYPASKMNKIRSKQLRQLSTSCSFRCS